MALTGGPPRYGPAPPGWYPDPSGAGGYRWWTGWTWGAPFSWSVYQAPAHAERGAPFRQQVYPPTLPPALPPGFQRRSLPWLVVALCSALGFTAAYAMLVVCLAVSQPVQGATIVLQFVMYLTLFTVFVARLIGAERAAAIARSFAAAVPPAHPERPRGSGLRRRLGRRRTLWLLAALPRPLAWACKLTLCFALLVFVVTFAAWTAAIAYRGSSASVTVLWEQRSLAGMIAALFAMLSVESLGRSRSALPATQRSPE